MGWFRKLLSRLPLLSHLVKESEDDFGHYLTDLELHGARGLWAMARGLLDRHYRNRGGKQWQYFQDEEVREIARLLCKYNPLAQGVLSGLLCYTLGDQGLSMEVIPAEGREEVPEDVEAATAYLKLFRDADDWWARERELYTRAHRDGEALVRFFSPAADGPPRVRPIEPEFVVPPDGSEEWTYGLRHKAGDVETILTYNVRYSPGGTDTKVSARNVYHIKLPDQDRVIKRGSSDFTSMAPVVIEAMRCLTTMVRAEGIRAAILYITQHPDSAPADLDRYIAGQTDYTRHATPASDRQTPTQEVRGIGEIHLTGKQQLAAVPAAERLGESITAINAALLAVGAKYHLPLWLISGDASRNNSVDVEAGSPFGIVIRSEQQWFGGHVRNIFWKVLQIGVEAGALRESVLLNVDVKMSPQKPVVRDPRGETERNQMMFVNKVMSRKTWQSREGLDPDAEEEALRAEAPPQPPPPAQGPVLPLNRMATNGTGNGHA